jgi:uncharacterized protein YndB with AHSA1/START domain
MIDAQTETRPGAKGDVTIAGGAMSVVFRRSYGKPIERVWAAITTAERLADWLGQSAEVDLRPGGKLAITVPGGYVMELRITRLEAPYLLEVAWDIDGRDTAVRFELAPTTRGCALTLTHSGLATKGIGPGVRAGWHAHLEGLADSIEHGRKTPWAVKEQREDEFAPLYR